MPAEACVVSPGQARLLRVWRVAGLAPLGLTRSGAGWQVAPSRRWARYSCCMILLLNTLTVVSLVAELQLPAEGTVRMRSLTRRLVWTVQSTFMVLASSAAVWSAPAQLREMIACYNQLQKINRELGIKRWPRSVSGRAAACLAAQAAGCVLFSAFNYTQTLISGSEIHEDVWINAFYLSYFLTFWVLQLQCLQFVLTVLHVKYSFTIVNKHLKTILEDLENSMNVTYSKEMMKVIEKYKRFNNFVRFPDVSKNLGGRGEQCSVRRLALAFAALCGVVRAVEHAHGFMVLVMLFNLLLHLICTPYYFIAHLLDDEDLARVGALNITTIVMKLLWCLYHTTTLVIMVEPCHLTHDQMSRTRDLVGQLTRLPRSSYDPLAMELDQFSRYLLLNQVHYEPLRFAKLSRSLIFTLLGSITTYTVVILHI